MKHSLQATVGLIGLNNAAIGTALQLSGSASTNEVTDSFPMQLEKVLLKEKYS